MKHLKGLVFLVCLGPFFHLIQRIYADDLGANPIEALSHSTGDWALRFLLITLSVTPIRRITGWSRVLLFRRMLGLYAFFYAALHFMVWLWLDKEMSWMLMLEDVVERPYITVGFTAFIMLLPLAATSNYYAMRQLGRNWKRLHRTVYVIAFLAVLHYIWLVKADRMEPYIYLLVFILLMLMRMPYPSGLLQRFRLFRA